MAVIATDWQTQTKSQLIIRHHTTDKMWAESLLNKILYRSSDKCLVLYVVVPKKGFKLGELPNFNSQILSGPTKNRVPKMVGLFSSANFLKFTTFL